MEGTGGKKHFPEKSQPGVMTHEQEIASRGFQREEGGALVVEPTDNLHGKGTHMDKPLVTDLSDPKRDEPLQTGGQFVGGRDAEIAHRGFDRKGDGNFKDEPKDDLHGKGTHMDKPLVTAPSDSKRDEPLQTGEQAIGGRDQEIAHRGFDRKGDGNFKSEPQEDLQGKGTHMDKPLVTGGEELKQGGAPQKELPTKASKHGLDNPGDKIRERFERTMGKAEDSDGAYPLVTGDVHHTHGHQHKEDLNNASGEIKGTLNPGDKIQDRFERTSEKVEEARLEGRSDQKEFVTKASKHVDEDINPGEKIRERFERTFDKVNEAEKGKIAEKFLIEKQNMDAGLKEEEVQHYLDKREQRIK